jgi:hypothetical protein
MQLGITNHSNECGMRSHGGGANHVEAERLAVLPRFRVQVVEQFHVVGNEADRGKESGEPPR